MQIVDAITDTTENRVTTKGNLFMSKHIAYLIGKNTVVQRLYTHSCAHYTNERTPSM